MPRLVVLVLAALLGLADMAGAYAAPPARQAATITIVHFNDIYEIQPVEGGRAGGAARLATVIANAKRGGGAVLTTLGGDYLSPSALGTARVDGEALQGRQMVDVLNALGLDWATLGNHEFDVPEAAFRAHLAQARFRIVSANVADAQGAPFPGVLPAAIVPVRANGRTLKIALIGITVDDNRVPWVRYRDGLLAARDEVAKLRGRVDAIVALTHLTVTQDTELVTALPEIDLVLGGHEHENWLVRRGPAFVPIVKADANARSVALVTLRFGSPGTRPEVEARLVRVDGSVPAAPHVEARVRHWTELAFAAFRREGFAPEAVIANSHEALDGRETVVNNRPGRLTEIIAAAFAHEAAPVDVALVNGGSVRLDDVLPAGPITEYDVIRILPFGGKVAKATMPGALLARVLDTGVVNEGLGGYLHAWGVRKVAGAWQVNGAPIEPARRYAVAMPAYLLTGQEVNLGFLNRTEPDIADVKELRDARRVLIEALGRVYPRR